MFSTGKIESFANPDGTRGFITKPCRTEEIYDALIAAKKQGLRISPMGTQNSFSDIFFAPGQLHLSMTGMNKLLHYDPIAGEIAVEAGMRICDVLRIIVPDGYYLTGLSGSFTDTIGGMISSNCHGKDSWKYGNFGDNVLEIKIMNSEEKTEIVDRNNELFYAVIAGLGALGIITEVKLKLRLLPSHTLTTSSNKYELGSLKTLSPGMADYIYGWTGIMHLKQNQVVVRTASFRGDKQQEKDAVIKFPEVLTHIYGLSPKTFWKLVSCFWNPLSYSAATFVIDKMQGRTKTGERADLIDYLYPWREYPGIRYLYKQNSFFEMQTLFPVDVFAGAVLQIKELIFKHGISPISSAIKWHRADDYYLSFSGNGLSVIITFDAALLASVQGQKLMEEYVELVTSLKGKFYLSKFPYLTKDQLSRSYASFEKWLLLKAKVDPNNLFLSDRIARLTGVSL